jgi:integrase
VKLPQPVRNNSADPDKQWVARTSAPRLSNGMRRQPRIYGRTQKECMDRVIEYLGDTNAGRNMADRRMTFGQHLDRRLRWWESEGELRSLDSYRETAELYLRPAFGHLKVIEMGADLGRDLAVALRKINRPEAADDRTDLMRRLLAARATRDGKRVSTRPLSAARITRILAVGSSACADLVPSVIAVNPFAKVKSGRGRKSRALLWTAPRVERWQQTGEIPGKVMVWTREQCGTFLDLAESERLYALFHLAAYYGPRRGELANLLWSDLDLIARRLHIRGDVKSEDSDRIVIIDRGTAAVLKAWRKVQLAERMQWGAAWSDTGRVFTRQDGSALRPEWISTRFDTLVASAKLPPITLHGLRHGAATMLFAAGVKAKVISEMLGHSTVSFTMDVYTEVAEELADDAASTIAAFVPRKPNLASGASNVPDGGSE